MQTEFTNSWNTPGGEPTPAASALTHLCCLHWLMVGHFGPLQELSSGHVLDGQTSNVERFIRWKSRRQCRKVSNHCECDAASGQHAIYLLPINGQTTKTTTITTNRRTTPAGWQCQRTCWAIDQSRNPASGQIGRFIKRDWGWQIMSLTIFAQDNSQQWRKDIEIKRQPCRLSAPLTLTDWPVECLPHDGATLKRS